MLPGTAAVAWQMLSEGGRSARSAHYSRLVEARGGVIQNEISADFARYCTVVPTGELELALWFEAGRMTPFAFTQGNFADRVEELESRYLDTVHSSPSSRTRRRLGEIAFQGFARYQNAPLPTPDQLQTLRLNDIVEFHRTFYRSSLAVTSVVGDFDPFVALDLAKKHLGAESFSGTPAPRDDRQPPHQTTPRLSVLLETDVAAPTILQAWRIPASDTRQHAALVIANEVLAGGEASWLYRDLVERRRLALGVDGWTAGHAGPDLFGIELALKSGGSVQTVEQAVDSALARLQNTGPKKEEIEAARQRALRRWMSGLGSNLNKARVFGEAEASGQEPATLIVDLESRLDVTVDEVKSAVREHLTKPLRSAVEIYPKDWYDPSQAPMPRYHIVRPGENLTIIAKSVGSTAAEVAKLNGISPKKTIFPGDKLRVPSGKARRARAKKKDEAIAYVVKKGDSLSSIAAKFKISVGAIERANGIDRKKPIRPGQKLAIPRAP
jgi:zinc protease